jgi:enamine deaminase RidA (YjgF/YER057c/UK114 family)
VVNDDETAAGLAPTPGYRYADRSGSQLFVAGQVPLDGEGVLVGLGSPEAQASQCLDNLRTLVELHGFTIGDVRQLRIYVVGPHQHLLDAWGAVVGWFAGDVPPATLLGVHMLGYTDQLVEIDATVHGSGSGLTVGSVS